MQKGLDYTEKEGQPYLLPVSAALTGGQLVVGITLEEKKNPIAYTSDPLPLPPSHYRYLCYLTDLVTFGDVFPNVLHFVSKLDQGNEKRLCTPSPSQALTHTHSGTVSASQLEGRGGKGGKRRGGNERRERERGSSGSAANLTRLHLC